MIKKIYLFTNRNIMAFDEKGEEMIDIQKAIGWKVNSSKKEREALIKIIHDKPIILMARWRGWEEPITVHELCCLLGHGKWYWDYKQKNKEE